MAANWTDEQRAAISVRDKKVLVAAGAGSGKTAVLTERVISRITDEKDPVDIDELLIMTFTRAAASEMRDRIFKRIEETISDYPYGSKMYERLRRQAVLVEYAKITTIDSFCLSVIREHIDMTPLDPSFRIADQGEINIIKDEVLSELMEEKYDSADEGYIRLVDSFAGAKSDVRIKEYIENLYSFASAKPWPQKWLKELLNSYKDGHDRKMWQDYIIERIKYIASDIEKKILLSLLAIEKVTTLKIHKILKDLGCIEKFSELSLEGVRVYFGDNAEEVYEKFNNNMKFDFVSYFDFYNVKCIFCDDVYYPQDFFRLYDYPFVIFYRGNKDLLLFKRKM